MNPDATPFTWTYVLVVLGFWFVAVPAGLFLLALAWRVADRAVDRAIDRHVEKALR